MQSALSLVPSTVACNAVTPYAAASFTASYTQIQAQFAHGVVCLILSSSLDQDVWLSFDGNTNHLRFPAGGTLVLDVRSWNGCLPGNYSLWGKELGNPTTGSLYVTYFTQG